MGFTDVLGYGFCLILTATGRYANRINVGENTQADAADPRWLHHPATWPCILLWEKRLVFKNRKAKVLGKDGRMADWTKSAPQVQFFRGAVLTVILYWVCFPRTPSID